MMNWRQVEEHSDFILAVARLMAAAVLFLVCLAFCIVDSLPRTVAWPLVDVLVGPGDGLGRFISVTIVVSFIGVLSIGRSLGPMAGDRGRAVAILDVLTLVMASLPFLFSLLGPVPSRLYTVFAQVYGHVPGVLVLSAVVNRVARSRARGTSE